MGRIVFLTLLSAAVSCVSIDGGAVEASWVVRTDDGRAITDCQCSDPQIASVRMHLEGASAGVMGLERRAVRGIGVTEVAKDPGRRFQLPPPA